MQKETVIQGHRVEGHCQGLHCLGLDRYRHYRAGHGRACAIPKLIEFQDIGTQEEPMKVKLKTYKYNGTLKREFSSIEEAQKFADLMGKKYPDMIFEPYVELGNSNIIGTSNSKEKEPRQQYKRSSESFVDRLYGLFDNED